MIERYRSDSDITALGAFLGTLFNLFIANVLTLAVYWACRLVVNGGEEKNPYEFDRLPEYTTQHSISLAIIVVFAMAVLNSAPTLGGYVLIRKRWKRGVTSAVTVLVWQLISYSAAVYFYRALTPEGDVHLGSAALVSLAVAVVLGAVDGILTKFALRAQGR